MPIKKRTSPDHSLSDRDLAALRARIDRLDAGIVRLLNQRTEAAMGIGRIKHRMGYPVFSPAREREVLNRVAALSRGPLRAGELAPIYREIMSAALACEGGLVLGVLRREGAAARAAARRRFGAGTVIRAFASVAGLRRGMAGGWVLVSEETWRALRSDGSAWRRSERIPALGPGGAFVVLAVEPGS